jgi:hypothetical protein
MSGTAGKFMWILSCFRAGVRYEAGQRDRGRKTEVVVLALDARGTALVPV